MSKNDVSAGRSKTISAEREAHILAIGHRRFPPPEQLTVSQWADKYRIRSPEYSAEPGPWRTSRVPYLREVMDSFCDPAVRHIVFVKSAQVGGSECMNNIMLYSIDAAPGPTLYVMPAQDDAAEEATGRIKRMMEQCERIQQYIPFEGFASSKRIVLKGPRNIYMAWAKAHRTLIRRAIRYVWFDELDNLERAAGVHGDELQKAKERVTTFGHRGKTMTPTTPLTESGAGWKSWLDSDRRTFRVPCPHCGAYQVLAFSQIKWPEDASPTEIRLQDLGWYECIECKERIEESQRWWMVQRGFWLPTDQSHAERLEVSDSEAVAAAVWKDGQQWTPAVEGEAPVNDHRGYHIWSAYSPWRTFSMIAAMFLASKGNPEKVPCVREFVAG